MFALLLVTTSTSAGERNVLVEMFTNSHCSICPGAHSAVNAYLSTSPNAQRLRFIYYHTTFPYSDDQLSLANTTEPNARNAYYNGPTSTPNTYFDGVNQGRTYSSFSTNLDARVSVSAPFDLLLFGTKEGPTISVSATISQTASVAQNDLVVHMVAVENVSYVGRNGVSPQNYVMRKMITPPAGDPFVMDAGFSKTVTHGALLTNITQMNNAGVVVFIQSAGTKEIFQSEYISASSLTGVAEDRPAVPDDFALHQNFPNPFNPSTLISFTVPRESFVTVSVFDLLGNEIAAPVRRTLPAGTHRVPFSAAERGLASGLYLYRLEAEGNVIVRKMMLLR